MEKKIDLSHETLYQITETYQVAELAETIENLVRALVNGPEASEELEKITEALTSFVNENHECFWLLVAVDQLLGKLYSDIEAESYENETEENTALFEFIDEFNSRYSEIVGEKITFSPEQEFGITFNCEDNTWSRNGGEEKTFPEIIIEHAGLKWSLNEEYSPAFDFEDERTLKKYKHSAISSLWLGLRDFARTWPDEEDMATCLFTVFDDALVEMSGTGYNWEIVETLLEKILYISVSEYNTEESDRDDLNAYEPYVYDVEKIAQEILDKDIFDLAPYRWGE